MGSPPGQFDKVWVEAEYVARDGSVVLTLVDVAERRRLAQVYGRHVASTKIERLKNFPLQYEQKMRQGYPVRFKMNRTAFEDMLTLGRPGPRGDAGFEGSGDDTTGGTYAVSGGWGRTKGFEGEQAVSYVVQSLTTSEGANDTLFRGYKDKWLVNNELRLSTRAEAEEYAKLFLRTGLPTKTRVLEVAEPPTHSYRNGRLEKLLAGFNGIPANEGFPGIDDDLADEPPTRDELNNSAVIQQTRSGYALVIDGKRIYTFDVKNHDVPQEAASRYARMWMAKNKYWPNLYFVNERGNVDLLDNQTGEIIMSWV